MRHVKLILKRECLMPHERGFKHLKNLFWGLEFEHGREHVIVYVTTICVKSLSIEANISEDIHAVLVSRDIEIEEL